MTGGSPRIRILVCDDHPIVRQGLKGLIDTEEGMEVVGEARDGVQAVQMAHETAHDIILLDLAMPGKDGIAAISEIRSRQPDARILVLTSFVDDEKMMAAIRAGALGYLLKESSPDDLLRAIREVSRGEVSLSPSIARKVIMELHRRPDPPQDEKLLTEREVQVLTLVARGLSNQEIADQLVLSERTARSHVSNILSKLQLASRTQAALYALQRGMVST